MFFINNVIVKKNVERIVGKIGFLKKNIFNIIFFIFLVFVISKYLENNFYIKFLILIYLKFFNIKDLIFKKDIGYYVFERLFFMIVVNFFFFLMIFVCIYIVVLYIVFYIAVFVNRISLWNIFFDKKVRFYIFFNFIFIFVVKIFILKYEMEGFLYFFFGEVVGVGYIDYYIRMNYFKFFYIVLAVVIVLSIYFFVKGKYINIGKVMFFYVGWVVLGIIILVGF